MYGFIEYEEHRLLDHIQFDVSLRAPAQLTSLATYRRR